MEAMVGRAPSRLTLPTSARLAHLPKDDVLDKLCTSIENASQESTLQVQQ